MDLPSLSLAQRGAILSCGIGVTLVTIGAALIVGSKYMEFQLLPTDDIFSDAGFSYPAWNEVELASGMILALLGTALSSASFTYLLLRRKKKRSSSELGS